MKNIKVLVLVITLVLGPFFYTLEPFICHCTDFFVALANIPLVKLDPNYVKLNPNFISGFSDGESSFMVTLKRNKNYKIGWQIQPVFSIELHNRDISLLYKIQSFFGVGNIRIVQTRDTVVFSVIKIKDLTNVIIPHFLEYSLRTQKQSDFLLFKSIVDLMNKGEHLTIEGLTKIVSIRASMNLGLTEGLKEAFPNITPIDRPKVEAQEIIDPY
jgi:hypothetical protein